jgi:serine/threonine-protein kinase RsbW
MTEAGIPWKKFTLEIESRVEAVPLLGQVVYQLCTAAGVSPSEGNQLEVCVVEAVNNSIKHGCEGDPACGVELEVSLSPQQLVFDIWDSGNAVDVAKIHGDHSHALDASADRVKDIPENGRGLALIQKLMDSFEYSPGAQRNRFRMIKHRDPDLFDRSSPCKTEAHPYQTAFSWCSAELGSQKVDEREGADYSR